MNLMMVDELGLEPWDEEESQGLWKQGLVTMLSFWFFGAIPVVGYAIIDAAGVDNASTIFAVDCVVTLFTMFALCAPSAPKLLITPISPEFSRFFPFSPGLLAVFSGFLASRR